LVVVVFCELPPLHKNTPRPDLLKRCRTWYSWPL
jgi:hypothetical protein